jgi:hypothetical protein
VLESKEDKLNNPKIAATNVTCSATTLDGFEIISLAAWTNAPKKILFMDIPCSFA